MVTGALGVAVTGRDDDLGSWLDVLDAGEEELEARLRARISTDVPPAGTQPSIALVAEVDGGLLVWVAGDALAAVGGVWGVEVLNGADALPPTVVPRASAVSIGVGLDPAAAREALERGRPPELGALVLPLLPAEDDEDDEDDRDDEDRTRPRSRRDLGVEGPSAPLDGEGGPVVIGALCPLGHLNAPTWTRCRRCSEDLAGRPLTQGPRPVLAALSLSDGQRVQLRRSVVVGRRPVPASHDGRRECDVIQVSSPGKVVSRTHFELSVIDWELRVIDRGSHNGTRLHRAGSHEIVLRQGQSAVVDVGDVIVFADMTATIGAPDD